MNEALTSIKGIGPGREKQLHKLGIDTVSNLLSYFPRSYEDRRKIYSIKELETGITAGVVGTAVSIIRWSRWSRTVPLTSSFCRRLSTP